MSDRNAVLRAAMELPEQERYELVLELWDVVEAERAELSDEQKAFLDRRRDSYDPSKVKPFDEVYDRLMREP